MKQGVFISGKAGRNSIWPGQPLVELVGDRRVLIEHHKGISQYSREEICVVVCFGQIIITGEAMEICQMSKEHLIIRGSIEEIRVVRSC